MKKIFLIFIVFLTLFNSINAYNSSLSDVYLELNGWCTNYNIEFTAYNKSEFEMKEQIEDNLCKSDENEEDDNCELFHNLDEFKVLIYNGPLKGMGLIYNESIKNTNGTFNFKFKNSNKYLIEIEPKNTHYNKFSERFDVIDCFGSSKTKTNENKSYNLSGNFDNEKIFVNLKNSNSSNISLLEINSLDIKSNNFSQLNNSIKFFKINSEKISYEDIEIIINIQFNSSNSINIFKYDNSTKKWIKYSNFIKGNNKLILKSINSGIYGIVEKKPIIIKQETTSINKNEKLNNSNKEINDKEINNKEINNIENKTNKSSSPNILIMIFSIIIIIGILVSVIILNKKKEEVKNDNIRKPEQLNTYKEIYDRTKSYIKQYKNDYSKDQIYRALKKVNIPEDIIDKIFLEEY